MITYPAIPLPSQTANGSAQIPVVRTDMPTGLIEQESRFAGVLRTFTVAWRMTKEEFAIFEEWFSEDLKGGVLTFGLDFDFDGPGGLRPFRFVGGVYSSTQDGGGNHEVQGTIECLQIGAAPVNRTIPVPAWYRVSLDPVLSQVLTFAHRNALLTSRPDDGSVTTLRVYPPTDPTAYIYFGIRNFGDGDTLITSEDVDPLPVPPTPSFPGALPRVNIGMQDNGSRLVSRLEMDGGHPRQWVEFDTTTKTYQVTWDFTVDQMQTFEAFFYATLRGGSSWFFCSLPVDGGFPSVPVRFQGATYSQSYRSDKTFRVMAVLERRIAQTETPPEWRPYGLYYGPRVNVTANRKITAGDAMKLFVVNPAEGQTISLHIYALDIEFGILKIGPGNVLITRGPFIVGLGEIGPDQPAISYPKASLAMVSVIKDLGSVGSEQATNTYPVPILEMKSAIKIIGDIGSEQATNTYPIASLEMLETLVLLGDIGSEQATNTYPKPTLALDIP